MNLETEDFSTWIGNTESRSDTLTIAPISSMAATLDKQSMAVVEGMEIPPLWHWLYFLPAAMQSELSIDGHPRKGDFLPPITLPRRMWAGSRFQFHRPLRIGESISRVSEIKNVSFKQGRSGQLAFICVGHEVSGENGVSVYEEHDIVYRDNPIPGTTPPAPKPAPNNADYEKVVHPDPVLLFRYSALTFNGHRIHYDRDYVTQVEGYPGLIVHGPLLATLLADTLLEINPGAQLERFEFKAVSPVFDLNEFKVCGTHADENGDCQLWIQNHEGGLCMTATANVTKK